MNYAYIKRASNYPGIDNLNHSLTINGTAVNPTFRYKLGDADATDLAPWGYGATLTRQAVATPPTYNAGSPGLGANDDSCKFNGSDYYKNDTAVNQFTTGDIVIEIVWKNVDAFEYLISTLVTNGVALVSNTGGTGNISLYLNDDDENLSISSTGSSAPEGQWNHAIVFVNRDEDSDNGSRWYINGLESGSGTNFSTAEKTLTSTTFIVGNNNGASTPYSSNIAYLAAWEYADWMQSGADGPTEWATIAAARFASLKAWWDWDSLA